MHRSVTRRWQLTDGCVFCGIVRGDQPSRTVWEDRDFIAILTLRPMNPGHTLVIPKVHTDSVFDLGDALYARAFEVTKILAAPLQHATGAARIGIVVEGFSIPHVHIHLVPLHALGDIDPARITEPSDDELTAVADSIRSLI